MSEAMGDPFWTLRSIDNFYDDVQGYLYDSCNSWY